MSNNTGAFKDSSKDVIVRSNLFEIGGPTISTIYNYNFIITPEPNKLIALKVFEETKKEYIEILDVSAVYDGSTTMYATKRLDLGDGDFEVTYVDGVNGASKFDIQIKLVDSLNLNMLQSFLAGDVNAHSVTLPTISALEVIFRYGCQLDKVVYGSSFYLGRYKKDMEDGLDVWPGIYQSIRTCQDKLYLNVDTNHTAFYQDGSLIEMVCSLCRVGSVNDLFRGVTDNQVDALNIFFKNAKITLTHQNSNREYTIKRIHNRNCNETIFDFNGQMISVTDYFKITYNIGLTFPLLPCVKTSRNLFLPLEICSLKPAQKFSEKLTDRQNATLIKKACQIPRDRYNLIMNGIEEMEYDNNQYLNIYGITLDRDMVKIPAKILHPPRLRFSNNSNTPVITPINGQWRTKDTQAYKPARMNYWSVISFVSQNNLPYRELDRFLCQLMKSAYNWGMDMKYPIDVEYLYPNGDIVISIQQHYNKIVNMCGNLELIIVILPDTSARLYGNVKLATDIILGIPSQCAQYRHVTKSNRQYLSNLVLKMNLKLGGVNYVLDTGCLDFVSQSPTIVLGADVSHPGPFEESPSVCALTASINSTATKFTTVIMPQESRKDIITDITQMMIIVLRKFYQYTGMKPGKILFYRDGVSEGQFKKVMEEEIKGIKEACETIEHGYDPKITFVLIQKKHHVRFFPSDKQYTDRSGNCLPGTLIDSVITQPVGKDFYLQSHAGLLGTSRPAHYHVLLDENNMTNDELYSTTFNLCFLYERASSAVSIVAPVYYANLATIRARVHIEISFRKIDEGRRITFSYVNGPLLDQMYFV